MIDKWIKPFSDLEAPCCPGKVEHWLLGILVIAFFAVVACIESWEDI